MKVAVLGANGFIGTRLVERLVLEGDHSLRVLLRRPAGLARLARFGGLDHRITNALDPSQLARDVEGCDVLVHAMVGDPKAIPLAAAAAATACRRSGLRLVYLSSASVHGQNPPPGTDESSPLSDRQAIPYNNAKVWAERVLRRSGYREIAVLRPGIVYGPRSQWTEGLRRDLRLGRAYLVEGGHGVCNHIYVDNLLHAILLCCSHPRACEGPFYVADAEAKSWKEFYRPLVEGWGYSMDDVWDVPRVGPPKPGLRERVSRLKLGPVGRLVLPRISRRIKDAAKAALERYASSPPSSGFALPGRKPPIPDYETSQLHTCGVRLPMRRAVELLGYDPIVAFDEAIRRCLCPFPYLEDPRT